MKTIKLKESDIKRIVKRVIKEEGEPTEDSGSLGGALGMFDAMGKLGKKKNEDRLKEITKAVKISEDIFNTILNLHNSNSKNKSAISYFQRFGDKSQDGYRDFHSEPNIEKFVNPILSSVFTKLIKEISNLYAEKYKNTNDRMAANLFFKEINKLRGAIKESMDKIRNGEDLKRLPIFNPNFMNRVDDFLSKYSLG